MGADDLARGRFEFAGGIGKRLTLLGEISIDELLVVAAGDEADLLRIRLVGEHVQSVRARLFADLWLTLFAERKQRAAQLLLRESEKEIRLVLGKIGRSLQDPALPALVILIARVVTGGDLVRADLPGHGDQLVE